MESLLCALVNPDRPSPTISPSQLQRQLDSRSIRECNVPETFTEVGSPVTDNTDVGHLAAGSEEFPDGLLADAQREVSNEH